MSSSEGGQERQEQGPGDLIQLGNSFSVRSFPDQGLAQVAFSYDDATIFEC